MRHLLACTILSCVTLASPAASGAQEPDAQGLDAKAALAILKGLAGTWSGPIEGAPDGTPPATVAYRVTAAGSTVVEELFPGTDHATMSVYHLDGPELRMTHYCSAGNQPRMILDRARSSPQKLVFNFDDGTNFDPNTDAHMHESEMILPDANHIHAAWAGYDKGKPSGAHRVKLQRQ